MATELTYFDSCDRIRRPLKGLKVSQDKQGKYWIWSDFLQRNVAIKQDTIEDAVLAAVNSLLWSVEHYKQCTESLLNFKARFEGFIESEGYAEKEKGYE